jgi:hypothetical protein
LDLLRVGFAQVFYGEVDADITDTAGNLGVFLRAWSVCCRVVFVVLLIAYQLHESIFIIIPFWFLLT